MAETEKSKFNYSLLKSAAKAGMDKSNKDSGYKPLYKNLYAAVENKDDEEIYEAQFKIFQKKQNSLMLKIHELKTEYNNSKKLVELVEERGTDYAIKTMDDLETLKGSNNACPDKMRILSNSTGEEYEAAKKKIPVLDSQIKLLEHDLDMTRKDTSNLVDIMNNG